MRAAGGGAVTTEAAKRRREAALQAHWAGVPPSWLQTLSGERLRVLFAGTWNHGPGPDFRGAIFLRPDGRPLRGDVEIHCRPGDWWRHGHQRDAAYAGVVLQLIEAGAGDARPRGPPAAAAAAPPLALLPEPLLESEAAAAGGEGAPPPAPWQPPCAQVVQEVGPQAVEQRLRRIAQGRLRAKVARLRGRLAASASVEEGVFQLLLEALGAGGNSAAMVALARRLPLARLPSGAGAATLAALLIAEGRGAAGGRPALPWRVATLRPANRPERRLAAAAALVVQLRARGGLAAGLRALAGLPEAAALGELRQPRLLGTERARQLLVDLAYPLALATTAEGDGASAQLERRWLALGGARYGRTEALRQRLTRGGLRRWRSGGTQALLELERWYCRYGACALCPVAALSSRPRRRAALGSPNIQEGGSPAASAARA